MDKKLRVLAAADLHGDFDVAKRLAEKAKKERVDVVLLAGDLHGYYDAQDGLLDPFSKVKSKVFFIPGNCDFGNEKGLLEKHAKCIHNYYVTYNGVGIGGIGSPNWKLSLNDDDWENIISNFSKMRAEKKIFVSHLHAFGTKAEFSGILGDKITRKAIEEIRPDIFIAGHIHEAEGLEERIGKTRVIQVGRKGTILEL